MTLTIIDSNFTTNSDWLFKLADKEHNVFYILNAQYYREIGLRSPIMGKHLHYYFKGGTIEAGVTEFKAKRIVTSVFEYSLS
jgi:hypothetical protein